MTADIISVFVIHGQQKLHRLNKLSYIAIIIYVSETFLYSEHPQPPSFDKVYFSFK